MFANFDPSLFDDPEFKEDAVREVIIAPILSRLGYHSIGKSRVIRSRNLIHPYIFIGTRKHPVTIIPDYTLTHEEQPVLILDAKSPAESVASQASIQQAYSYAYHPEIRCKHFALCNERTLILYSTDSSTPLLSLAYEEYESRWSDIEKHFGARFLLQPELRKFEPDFGFRISKLGFTTDSELTMFGVRLGIFARITDSFYSASTSCALLEENHCVFYDFAVDHLSRGLCS